MPQVVRTTNDLIVNSLYLTGELGVGETPDSFMLSTGLELVNEIIDSFSADNIFIPYLNTIEFTMTAGQAEYSISDLVSADITSDRIIDLVFATYDIETITYPIKIINKATYFNVVRLASSILQSRPGFAFLDKEPLQSLIVFYPAPDKPYPCTLKIKQMIDKLDAQEDLTNLPPFYYGFLKYALARKFNAYYPSSNWPPQNEEEYQRYFSILKNSNETDLTIRPSIILDAPQPFYWANILVI